MSNRTHAIEIALELVAPRTVAIVAERADLDAWLRSMPGKYIPSRCTVFIGDSQVRAIPIESARSGLRGPRLDRVVVVGEPSDLVGSALTFAKMSARGNPGEVVHVDPSTRSVTRWGYGETIPLGWGRPSPEAFDDDLHASPAPKRARVRRLAGRAIATCIAHLQSLRERVSPDV